MGDLLFYCSLFETRGTIRLLVIQVVHEGEEVRFFVFPYSDL